MAIKVPESLSSNLFIVADNGHNEKMCSIPRVEKALIAFEVKTNSKKKHAGKLLFGGAGDVQIPLFANRICATLPHHFEIVCSFPHLS